MIQTSFFPQPEEDKPEEIIQIDPSGLQPKKVEELLPDDNIQPDTFMIYPTGGYHPFYGTPNTFPRYQLPVWPCVRRIKFAQRYNSQEAVDRIRSNSKREHHTINHLNPYWDNNYYYINFDQNSYYTRHHYKVIKKNGRPSQSKSPTQKRIAMHRIVAFAWIPNPENKPYVMHINDDATNYLINNLKWGTPRENMKGKISRRPDTMEQKYLNLVGKGIIKG
tara:strand:+ start:18 stop:680 length:663 start_codon:yes stop_codon:yes gene_type:complete